MSQSKLKPIDGSISFPKAEEEIIKFWREKNAFHTQNKLREGRPRYNFYDGPPFATGTPHYGHILAATIKDTVTRDAVMNNFYVERRFGWDTHGLPVENQIDKKFGIKTSADVEKLGGVGAYNAECRKIVMTYSGIWEETVERLGRWIDFENDYKTLYPTFMESVWWVFKQLFDKGLVYSGVKIMPYSTGCTTTLSNFEVAQNYKDTQDPFVVVNFPFLDEPDTYLTAWTTTPWTLPSNLALCVHPDHDYVKVLCKKRNMKFILMEARLCELYKSEEEYEVLEKFQGKSLKGRAYKPLFEYFNYMAEKGAFRVCVDSYVTTDAGTGIVHQSPFNGADDYRVAIEHGYIKKADKVICPLDEVGRFTKIVKDYEGMYIKDADKQIIKDLREKGRLVNAGSKNHSYPFCWRTDTPIIYRAMPSWFVRVEDYREDLLKSNAETYWVPNHVKEKRFKNWLANANDWAISRSRYWGTPIPIWASPNLDEIVCIGSIKELEELSGQKITDLHRENIDPITIPSKIPGRPPLKRIPEVFDCWFESGSMPYAQQHYPFENKKQFEDSFPAEFIAEGIDQTRGWFYTLTVIGTLLYGRCPFKNIIVNGLVLAADGQKMSKSKKNYTDPNLNINNYGADAIRLYLINSPVVRAEDLKFDDKGVKDIIKDVFLPWYNVYKFAVQTAIQYEHDNGKPFKLTKDSLKSIDNDIDKWILSELGTLVSFVQEEMKAYRLYTVTPKLVLFIDTLSKWYIKLIRDRVKDPEDAEKVLVTLTQVLFILCRRMAPFTPFLTEHIYQGMKPMLGDDILADIQNSDSIHYLLLPEVSECGTIDKDIERAMHALQTVVTSGRVIRDQKVLGKRQPLAELVVVHEDQQLLNDVRNLQDYIQSELNVKKITISNNKSAYGIQRRAIPDIKKLGQRLKKESKKVCDEIRKMDDAAIEQFLANGSVQFHGHHVNADEIKVTLATSAGSEKYVPNASEGFCCLLDCELNQELTDEFLYNEIRANIQNSKKLAKLVPTDKVLITFKDLSKEQNLINIASKNSENIRNHVRSGFSVNQPDYSQLEAVGVAKADCIKLYSNTYTMNDKSKAKYQIEIYGQEKIEIDDSLPVVTVGPSTVILENPKGTPTFNNLSSLQNIFKSADIQNKSGNKISNLSEIVPGHSYKIAGASGDSAKLNAKNLITVNQNDSQFYVLKENYDLDGNLVKLNNLEELKRVVTNLVDSPDRDSSKLNLFEDKDKKQKLTDLKKVGAAVYV